MEKYVCSYCNQSTSNVEYDYLVGYDHLSCFLKSGNATEKEKCVLCGVETNYLVSENINNRIGYIEGAGQLCETCYSNGTNREHIAIPINLIKNTSNDSELGSKIREFYYNNTKS